MLAEPANARAHAPAPQIQGGPEALSPDLLDLLQRVPAILYIAEAGGDGAWRYVSPQIEEILGFTPQDWRPDPRCWARPPHPHDREMLLRYVAAALAKMRLRKDTPESAPKLLLHMHLLRPLGSPHAISGYFFAPNVDRFLAVSHAVRAYLLRAHRQLRPEQVVVAPNSVDIQRFQTDPQRGADVRRPLVPPRSRSPHLDEW